MSTQHLAPFENSAVKLLPCKSTKTHPHQISTPAQLTVFPGWRKSSPRLLPPPPLPITCRALCCAHKELVWRLINNRSRVEAFNQSEQQIIALCTTKKDRLSFYYWFQQQRSCQLHCLYFSIFLLSKFSTCTSLKDKKTFVGALYTLSSFPPWSPCFCWVMQWVQLTWIYLQCILPPQQTPWALSHLPQPLPSSLGSAKIVSIFTPSTPPEEWL